LPQPGGSESLLSSSQVSTYYNQSNYSMVKANH